MVTWKVVTENTRHCRAKWKNHIPMLRQAQTVLGSCRWIPWTSLPTSELDHDSFLPLGWQIPLTFPPQSLPFLSSCLPDSESGISSPGQKLRGKNTFIWKCMREISIHTMVIFYFNLCAFLIWRVRALPFPRAGLMGSCISLVVSLAGCVKCSTSGFNILLNISLELTYLREKPKIHIYSYYWDRCWANSAPQFCWDLDKSINCTYNGHPGAVWVLLGIVKTTVGWKSGSLAGP